MSKYFNNNLHEAVEHVGASSPSSLRGVVHTCSVSECRDWRSFCADWDDQVEECEAACDSYCIRDNLCRDMEAQELSAFSENLETACPSVSKKEWLIKSSFRSV